MDEYIKKDTAQTASENTSTERPSWTPPSQIVTGAVSDNEYPRTQRPMTSYEADKAAGISRAEAARYDDGRSTSSASASAARSAEGRSTRTTPSRASRSSSGTERTSSRAERSAKTKAARSERPARTRTSGSAAAAAAKDGSKPAKKQKSTFLPFVLFPLFTVWLELVLHIFMGMELKYAPIYILHGLMYGFIFSFITKLFPKKASLTISKIWAFIMSLLFGVEFIAKNILQDFYPASMLKTAAGNHLSDYIGAIVIMIGKKIHVLILFFLPVILAFIFLRKPLKSKIKKRGMLILSLICAVLFYFLGRAAIAIPFHGNLTPKELYNSDTNYNDQVEQLGLINMLRLDIKHMIWPVESEIDVPDDPTPVDPEPEDPEQAKYKPNKINLDFAQIQKDSSNNNIKQLAQYFSTVTPTMQNEYTGTFKDYNVVFFTVEGLSGYALDPMITPTLWKITHEGFVFNNYYTALHFTSTSNGECQHLLGLYPKSGFPISMSRTGELKTNTYFSLARQLNRLGYKSYGYHNNINMYGRTGSHPNLGYDWRYIHYTDSYKMYADSIDYEGAKGLNQGKLRWMQRDSFMVEHTVEDYINSDKPFNVYYLTVSGHTPYTYTSWAWGKSGSNWIEDDRVKAMTYTEKTKAYEMAAMEVDKAVEILIQKLQEAGKLEKTLIVLSPDHVPYADIDAIEELAGKKFGSSSDFEAINERNIDFEVYHSCLAIWNPNIETKQIDKVCCQVDILPTVSNLLGLEYDSRMLGGTDILSSSEGLVVFASKSWRSDKGFYSSFTKKFTPNPGVNMSQSAMDTYVKYMDSVANNRLKITNMIIESNFYNFALGSNKYIREESETQFELTKEQLEKLYEYNAEKAVIREYKDPRTFEKKEVRPF
ncbi:MAG: sulfatase-like hydrolase/transferase [Clostridia bacterium]|nr:sulfatase-like hydrolase/transferase [Clostridia bacterium]